MTNNELDQIIVKHAQWLRGEARGVRANLTDADLRRANLTDADLSAADLSFANLGFANLTDADLIGANLTDADLRRANLTDADLSAADLSGANLTDDGIPVIDGIDTAILVAVESEGNTLNMGDWHSCDTTHCRAGWAVHLAGDAGYELERRVGPAAAGALIYAASGSHPVPDFYADNETALADMRERAANAGRAS